MNKIFITGGAGFVGAQVVRQLIGEGRDVAVLMRPSTNSRRINDLLKQCTVIEGDLAGSNGLESALKKFAPNAVLHLAWDGVMGADRNNSVQMLNVSNSLNLYKLTESIGCRHFLGLGSQAEYGPLTGRISEAATTKPTTTYGAAKLATCMVLERAAAASGRPFTWLRLFSSYGPDDNPNWLIPYLIQSLLKRERPSLTRAEQIWDYIHVNDVAAGVVKALDTASCGIFNLGSGKPNKLREIISMVRDAIDPSLPLGFGDITYRPDQVMHLEANIEALSLSAQWVPKISLESGIGETVSWYRKNTKF